MRRPLPTCMFFLFLFPLTLHMALTHLDTSQPHWLAVYEQVSVFLPSPIFNLSTVHVTTVAPDKPSSFTALPASTIPHLSNDFDFRTMPQRQYLLPGVVETHSLLLSPTVHQRAVGHLSHAGHCVAQAAELRL